MKSLRYVVMGVIAIIVVSLILFSLAGGFGGLHTVLSP